MADIESAIRALELLLDDPPLSRESWPHYWRQMEARADELADLARLYLGEAPADGVDFIVWADALLADVRSYTRDVDVKAGPGIGDDPAFSGLQVRLHALAARAEALCQEMDFRFLFDSSRKLFSIGYRVADDALDESVYDLLASEARLASFIAIAEGHVPVVHWSRLSRLTCAIANEAALVSWSGSMFEYLMPSLVMYTPRNSLLDRSCRLMIQQQKNYGKERHVPWGVSESAYNLRDHQFSYQYSAFGVPGLGLKRGLGEDLVVAPYATALAAMYDPHSAIRNFRELAALGARGAYGYYEALDFTPSRLPEDVRFAVVRAYMAHHQGMSLVALANVVFDGVMRRRFHRQPLVRAAELLLQERAARLPSLTDLHVEDEKITETHELAPSVVRSYRSPHQQVPACQLLSNSRYSVMITGAGGGYSRLGATAVTRWREDPTRDSWGSFIYLRDTATGAVWSAGYQPTGIEADRFEIVFAEDRARLIRHDDSLCSTLEIMVSPEDDAEIRRLSITNNGKESREIDVTSYAEIVLAPVAADVAHPAFSNLFVHTEYVPNLGLLAHRRPRLSGELTLWAAHLLAGAGAGIEFESDRARFLGRGRDARAPAAVMDGQPLSNTVGAVLDPIFSLRTTVRIAPGAVTHLVFSLVVAPTRETLLTIAEKYREPTIFERISNLAWTHSRVRLHHLGIEPDEADTFQFLATRLLYSDPQGRPSSDRLQRNVLGKSALWRFQISGDHPLVLLRIDRSEDRVLVRQLLRAQQYWRSKGLVADVVVLNEAAASYSSASQQAIEEMIRLHGVGTLGADQAGGIFVLRATELGADERLLLLAVARVIVVGREGSLAEQSRRSLSETATQSRPPVRAASRVRVVTQPPRRPVLFDNGFGGFADDGREYVITLTRGRRTPLPWINVIANPTFGFQISEAGSGYTWSLNSRENQLTPWRNDPVSDGGGEAFYLQDQESGALWSPTCYPIYLEHTQYVARHGQGYSVFEHAVNGIATELTVFVSPEAPLRIAMIAIRNETSRMRRVNVTAYLELLLGTNPQDTRHVVTEFDHTNGVLLARNAWAGDFAGRVLFAGWTSRATQWTANRREFIGRNGSLQAPAALLAGVPLSGQIGAGVDPCAVLQISLELPPGQTSRATFVCGQAEDRQAALRWFDHSRRADSAQMLARVRADWDDRLNQIQIETPDLAFNILVNRWLLYQVLSCRMWGRAGLY
ncbi:MAG: glucoamylase family protein, partial [Gammaproteobacteria bacterium]